MGSRNDTDRHWVIAPEPENYLLGSLDCYQAQPVNGYWIYGILVWLSHPGVFCKLTIYTSSVFKYKLYQKSKHIRLPPGPGMQMTNPTKAENALSLFNIKENKMILTNCL